MLAACAPAMAALLAAIGWGPDRGFDQFGLRHRPAVGRVTRHRSRTAGWISTCHRDLRLDDRRSRCLPDGPGRRMAVDAGLAGGLSSSTSWAVIAIAPWALVAVIYARDRLTAIVSLGMQGFAVGAACSC
jgi:multicomponent Na+:H+ antiporter subunit A